MFITFLWFLIFRGLLGISCARKYVPVTIFFGTVNVEARARFFPAKPAPCAKPWRGARLWSKRGFVWHTSTVEGRIWGRLTKSVHRATILPTNYWVKMTNGKVFRNFWHVSIIFLKSKFVYLPGYALSPRLTKWLLESYTTLVSATLFSKMCCRSKQCALG